MGFPAALFGYSSLFAFVLLIEAFAADGGNGIVCCCAGDIFWTWKKESAALVFCGGLGLISEANGYNETHPKCSSRVAYPGELALQN
ncbi:hypothetical protein ACHAXS_004303 [Conticribra weissflogii]